ncbi:MAG: hypothetical protein JO287_13050 [Pseudonocardiales bacterium]|nr:hypothetical protein [Pseudonocardiales bacterium]
MSTRRVLAAMMAIAGALSIVPGAMLPAAAADGAPTDSAVTVSGKGEFADLKVTVSQTKNLIDQVVTVSWTGALPTVPSFGQFGINYLQIMQCWGDDPAGPDRTQCQYGGLRGQTFPAAGSWVRRRQVSTGGLVDPNEPLKKPADPTKQAFVPFWVAGRDQPAEAATTDLNDFFDDQVTNEIPLARTHGDGTGQEFFEIETIRQAAGLGCGDPVTQGGVTKGRSCWLVVVPRGNKEVDGSIRNGETTRLDSSPLSQTNWDNRIAIPLEFRPVGQACPLGSAERRVIGNELAVDAVGSWQPALCGSGGGSLYSYTQLTDDGVRAQVLNGGSPGLGLASNPIPPDQTPTDHPLVYAPVTLSGLAIAFYIEHQPNPSADETQLALGGIRFTSMKLTPRLVAKLLTQSYSKAVEGSPDYLKNNPAGLTVDPEFLKLNPEYKDFSFSVQSPDALTQLFSADATSLLWSWIKSDPDAEAFLSGKADEYGMVVNPNNKDLQLPTSTFPRNDQSCIDTAIAQNGSSITTAKKCTLDTHPYTTDMHDAGRSTSRGDTQARVPVLDTNSTSDTPQSKLSKLDRQAPGQRALLAVVDTETAMRYGLTTAALRNAAGNFVAPTTQGLLAGEAGMTPSAVPGVLAPNPTASDPEAYPLTALSYAISSPSQLDAAAGKDYATFLRYVAGPGQQPGIDPGQLPPGLAPLPDALKKQTIAAAATIEAQAGKTASSAPPSNNNSTDVPGITAGRGTSNTGSSTAGTNDAGSSTTSGPGTSVAPATTGNTGNSSKAPSLPQQVAGVVRRTPPLPAPAWVGGLLIATLICGGLAATCSPVLHSPAIYRIGAEARRLVRRGVRSPEQ